MLLTYYGHCAFGWQTPGGLRVLADPYRNQADRYWFTRQFPDVACDLGLISHAHFDHDAADRLPKAASILRMPGHFNAADLQIRGIGDYHSGPPRLKDFPNVMFRLQAANGATFLHLGDNRAHWPANVTRAVGEIDVLMVTVDDSLHLLTYDEVDALITRLQPRIVIPMHYAIPNLTAPESGLQPPEQWLKRHPNIRRLETHQTEITPSNLPTQTEIWLFQPAPQSLTAPAAARQSPDTSVKSNPENLPPPPNIN